jgi:phage terminase small subunit
MPAKKPSSLITRAETKADKQARKDAESVMEPKELLKLEPPQALTGHAVAKKMWRRMITMYRGLDAKIVSRLDEDMLVDYCILYEQGQELDKLRTAAGRNYTKAQKVLDKKFESDDIDPKTLIKLSNSVNWCLGEIVKLDARADMKRKHLFTLRQSLYMTPRSRAGVAHAEKPKKQPKSDMANLLDRKK